MSTSNAGIRYTYEDCGRVLTAPLDVVLGQGDKRSVVQPDILFIPAERSEIVTDEIVGAPGLVVEVLSPGTSSRDRRIKKSLYARSGVGSTGSSLPTASRSRSSDWARKGTARHRSRGLATGWPPR